VRQGVTDAPPSQSTENISKTKAKGVKQ